MLLDALGHKYGTDKASGSHDYLRWYEPFISHLRQRRHLGILEIGVGDGNSLRMWRDYFPLAEIVGLDVRDDRRQFAGPRIAIEIGDQENVDDLRRVVDGHGPFNLIIDDGGHSESQQITSYRELLPRLCPGGIYFLEDIGGQSVINMLTDLASEVIRQQHPFIEAMGFYRETSMTRVKG